MSKIKKYIEQLLELRKENSIDPFNFSLLKYASWETSLQSRLQEHTQYVTPKIIEIIVEVLKKNVDEEDLEKIASLQVELTDKYSGKLLDMDKEINSRVEEYLELYNEAIERIMEDENNEKDDEIDYDKIN